MVQMSVVDTGDLKRAVKELRGMADGKQLRRELVAELRDAARPLVPKVKAAWLGAPSRHARPELRRQLARATWLQVRVAGRDPGVAVRTDGRRMPTGRRALPGYAEGIRRRGWRHPVYGNREVWVVQRPIPRFYAAARPDEAAVRRAVEAAVDKVFDRIGTR